MSEGIVMDSKFEYSESLLLMLKIQVTENLSKRTVMAHILMTSLANTAMLLEVATMLAKFTGLKRPTFDDYISDLSIMFETYPTEGKQQLHDVRLAMALIDDLAAVADKLPKLPRGERK